jgi:hypothetical protein
MRFQEATTTIEDTLNRFYPVGSLFLSVLPTNPAELFGIGTWVAFAAGRALVGVDAADPDFDAAEKTSGAKTVTLTEAQIPSHTHVVADPGHTHVETNNSATTGPLVGFAARDTSTNSQTATGYSTESATTGISVGNTGGGASHPNVQPSIAIHIWKRTA